MIFFRQAGANRLYTLEFRIDVGGGINENTGTVDIFKVIKIGAIG